MLLLPQMTSADPGHEEASDDEGKLRKITDNDLKGSTVNLIPP